MGMGGERFRPACMCMFQECALSLEGEGTKSRPLRRVGSIFAGACSHESLQNNDTVFASKGLLLTKQLY